jgi:tetratricopeptide (TPR) repeat protein
LQPQNPVAWCARGNAYFLLGRYSEAVADLKEAMRMRPDYAEARRVLEQAEGAIAAQAASLAIPSPKRMQAPVAPQPEPVIPMAEIPLVQVKVEIKPETKTKPDPLPTADPKSAAEHNQRGRELLKKGQLRESIEELGEAIRLDPGLSLAYNARGFAYYLSHETRRATADLDDAIRLNPKYVNAYQNRSIVRRAMGDAAGSAADAAKVRELSR